MQIIRNVFHWLLVSSVDAQKWSSTVKFTLLGAIPAVMQIIGLACGFKVFCIETSENDLQVIALTIANLAYFSLSVIATFGTIASFVRKIIRTANGTNAAMKG